MECTVLQPKQRQVGLGGSKVLLGGGSGKCRKRKKKKKKTKY